MNKNYAGNVCFYDANYNKIDDLGSEKNFLKLSGYSYNNLRAAYMRIGCYMNGGPTYGSEYNFAYTYNSHFSKLNNGICNYPLYENKILGTGATSSTEVSSDYMKYDFPTLITSKDITKLKLGVVIYNDNKEIIKTHYIDNVTIENSRVPVPSNTLFKIYCRRLNKDDQISILDVIENINIIKSKYGNYRFTISNSIIQYKYRVGCIDLQYTDVPLILHCDDTTKYKYNLALCDPNLNYYEPPYFVYNDKSEDMLIPANSYYKYNIGPSVNADITPDEIESYMNHIIFKKIPEMDTRLKSAISNIGKLKLMNNNEAVPSYYTAHMDEKIETILNLKQTCALQFIFITDYHYGTYNNTHTVRPLLTKLVTDSGVNIIINGGDTWTSGNKAIISLAEARSRLMNGLIETQPLAPCEYYFLLGNHDTGLDYKVSNGNTTTYGPYFTTNELSEIIGGPLTGRQVISDPASKGMAYYFDIDSFRFIFINPTLNTLGSSETDEKVYAFLASALLDSNNKKIIILSHVYYNSSSIPTGVNNCKTIIEAYNNRSTAAPTSAVNAKFTNCTGKVICWIAGHSHADSNYNLSDGTPVIVTTTCNAGGEMGGLDRSIGTINENAFDVFSIDTTNHKIYVTRIGAGSDREFTYTV